MSEMDETMQKETREDEAEHTRPKRGSRAWSVDAVFWTALLVALVFSSGALYRRLSTEWSHRTVAMVFEYADLLSLSLESGEKPEAIYERLRENGAVGITVAEFTGKDLSGGVLALSFAPLSSLALELRAVSKEPLERGAILADSTNPFLPEIMQYLRIKMPGTTKHVLGQRTLIVLPVNYDLLGDSGLVPDFAALAFARRVGAVCLFRSASTFGADEKRVGESMSWLVERNPSVRCVLPAGSVIAGYPDMKPFAQTLRASGISVAQVEFVKQIGAPQFCSEMKPNVIPLHSLVRDELIARRMTRAQVVERMVRAVHERSIRAVLVRPYDIYGTGRLAFLLEDTKAIHDSLRERGYAFGWPSIPGAIIPSFASALGFSIVFLVTVWFYARHYGNRMGDVEGGRTLFALSLGALLLGIVLWKVSIASRLAGGLCAAFLATDATIWALDRYEKPFAGLVAGLLVVLGGGLVLAAFYGTTDSMLRLTPFSGVKLTLLLPPLLILALDLKRRVHPESISEILKRAPFWGELVLCAVLLVGVVLLTVRSDNAAFVPGWEIRFREALERLLWVRPRTKEFLVGYPCLVVYYALVKRNWAPHYREVFRVGASLALASAVNSFSHFHTLLPLTIIRVVNGWWLGILAGFALLVLLDYVGGPLWRRGGRELFD